MDKETNLDQLKEWEKHYTPKDTAISIALEAAVKYPVSLFNKDSDAGYEDFKRIKREYRQGKTGQ